MNAYENVKICVASRELTSFEEEFRSFSRIRVHECTARSIAQYSEGRLREKAPNLTGLYQFVSAIKTRSRGVYLWVQIVVDLLITEYRDGNFEDEMWKKFDALPRKLGGKDGLYMHMMRRIRTDYLDEFKRLVQLSLSSPDEWSPLSFDIITLFLAAQGHLKSTNNPALQVKSDDYQLKTWNEWQPRREHLEKRLKSRCNGLLEGTDPVQFIHQTAKQFFLRKYLWDQIFRKDLGFTCEIEIQLAAMSGLVRRLKCCREAVVIYEIGSPIADNDPWRGAEVPQRSRSLFTDIFNLACSLDSSCSKDIHKRSYIGLLDELDEIGEDLTRELRTSRSESSISWPDIYWRRRESLDFWNEQDLYLGNMTFLDCAMLHGLCTYTEEKFRDRTPSEFQLANALFRATRRQNLELRKIAANWIGARYSTLEPSPTTVQLLF